MESDNAVSFGPERASPFARGLPQCTARKALPPRNLPRENECRPPGCTAPTRPPAVAQSGARYNSPGARSAPAGPPAEWQSGSARKIRPPPSPLARAAPVAGSARSSRAGFPPSTQAAAPNSAIPRGSPDASPAAPRTANSTAHTISRRRARSCRTAGAHEAAIRDENSVSFESFQAQLSYIGIGLRADSRPVYGANFRLPTWIDHTEVFKAFRNCSEEMGCYPVLQLTYF